MTRGLSSDTYGAYNNESYQYFQTMQLPVDGLGNVSLAQNIIFPCRKQHYVIRNLHFHSTSAKATCRVNGITFRLLSFMAKSSEFRY